MCPNMASRQQSRQPEKPEPSKNITYIIIFAIYSSPSYIFLLDLPALYKKLSIALILSSSILYYMFEHGGYVVGDNPELPERELYSHEQNMLIENYKELNEEFRYRDKLMLQNTYFSFAVIGILINIFFTVGNKFKPMVSMIGSLFAFGFAVSITAQKRARDSVYNTRNNIESADNTRGLLNVNRATSIQKRPFILEFSASSYVENLHMFIFLTSYLTYILTIWVFSPVGVAK